MPDDILNKIKSADLTGRGGAGFPVYKKWEAVKKAKGTKKYVICNASEREPGVKKDLHILENFPEVVFKGLKIAMDCIETKECYFNFNEEYYEKLKDSIDSLVSKYKEQGYKIRIYKEKISYIGGEETALLNAIEGLRVQPRLKPPYPTDEGLYGMPTLVHNVETLYDVALIAEGKYEGKRFYTISGKVNNPGIHSFSEELTIADILKETGNTPDFEFFVHARGGASGIIHNSDQIKKEKAGGTGAIIVHKIDEDPRGVILSWLEFFNEESCGKCTPCREGTYQLYNLVKKNKKKIPWEEMSPILDVLDTTSFCPLGKSVSIPIKSYKANVLSVK